MSSSQGQAGQPPKGPPYASKDAALGGLPTKGVDIPISAIIIAFFISSAVLNMVILQRNRRRGTKFLMSYMLFGFSMTRIVANMMRIVWACYPHNIRIALAASILTNAGTLILFVVDLILAQRILRSYQPSLGWKKPLRIVFKVLYVLTAVSLIMVIVAIVYNAYTLNPRIKSQLRAVQLTSTTFMAVLAFLPIPIILAAILLPRKELVDEFGQGSPRVRIAMVLFTSGLLTFGAAFRAGIQFQKRPITEPEWFHHKAVFYCLYYLIEITVVYTLSLSRFDRRFHVPNGCHAPGDYTAKRLDNDDKDELEIFVGDTRAPRVETKITTGERSMESSVSGEMFVGNTRAPDTQSTKTIRDTETASSVWGELPVDGVPFYE